MRLGITINTRFFAMTSARTMAAVAMVTASKVEDTVKLTFHQKLPSETRAKTVLPRIKVVILVKMRSRLILGSSICERNDMDKLDSNAAVMN